MNLKVFTERLFGMKGSSDTVSFEMRRAMLEVMRGEGDPAERRGGVSQRDDETIIGVMIEELSEDRVEHESDIASGIDLRV
jgi:hypothetical protein